MTLKKVFYPPDRDRAVKYLNKRQANDISRVVFDWFLLEATASTNPVLGPYLQLTEFCVVSLII